ncbi:Response regulator receiver domain-containing protein [Bradyrhizobium sp. Rc2d]|uniref:response regulator n=1 Tax=Bradyrhizobium sp. Rc2d TaxID=1855321 RepID=UPI000883C77D|nr:response regulator [Bradyrhizobium sp. Rc2d]SDJ11785.1 Response regulator receiver domain-containing protein [Bradyrhizobium sp. Rc2d]
MNELPVVLIAEDEEELQHILQEALRDAGFDFTSAASGEQAVTLLKSGVVHYRALVTDIKLDGPTGGWEVARQARLIDPAFPVVYMTGGHAGEWPVQGVPNSVLLQKPFATAQLITAISQLLNVGSSMLGPPQPSP